MRSHPSRGGIGLTATVALLLTWAVTSVAAAPGWTDATRVVPALGPLSPSVAVDGAGRLHIAFVETSGAGPAGVFYATNAGGWHRERVTTGDDFYARPSIALDEAGNAFIAFARVSCPDPDDPSCEGGTSRIYLAANRTGAWVLRPRTAGPADLAPSLAAHDGKLHLAFQRRVFPNFLGGPTSGIWYASNATGSWAETQIASAEGRCYLDQLPSLAIDAEGSAFIAYEGPRTPTEGCTAPSSGIRLATNEAGAWVRGNVSTNRNDVGPSLALDPSGRPGVAFDRGGTGVEFSRRFASGWTAPSLVAVAGEASLAFDAAGRPRIAYELNGIWHATKSSSGWARTKLYSGPVDYGTYGGPRIALVPATGKARIVFARPEPGEPPREDDLGIWLVRQE